MTSMSGPQKMRHDEEIETPFIIFAQIEMDTGNTQRMGHCAEGKCARKRRLTWSDNGGNG
jgi:hypothetical protein